MKKRIVFWALTTFFVVGCEQVQEFQGQLEDWKTGTIASINEQVSDIQASLKDLEQIDAELKDYLKTLRAELAEKDESLKINLEALIAADAALEQRITELKSYCEQQDKSIRDWVSTTFATLEQRNTILEDIASIKVRLEELDEAIGTPSSTLSPKISEAKTRLMSAIAKSEASIKGWVNEQLSGYYTIAQADAKLKVLEDAFKGADKAIANDVVKLREDLEKAKTDLTSAYQIAISEVINTNNGVINAKIASDIKTASDNLQTEIDIITSRLDGLEKRISALESSVADLIGMVQSVVVVPDYSDGSVKMTGGTSNTIRFEIYPLDATKKLADAGAAAFSLGYVATETKSSIIESIPISTVSFDGEILSVIANGSNFPEEIKSGRQGANARLCISDGNSFRSSEYFLLSFEHENDDIADALSGKLFIQIPDVVYAVVGTELNLWNDAISLSVDRGLASPLNYQVRWQCSKGTITDRCFRYTPIAEDADHSYVCTCYLYDMSNHLMASKQFAIKVLAKNALSSAKNIVYFGDSLGASAANALYEDFSTVDKFTGTVPAMLGTNGTNVRYEAIGGYGWVHYATKGASGYRVFVNGVTSVGIGAVYSDGHHLFSVYEVNISEGSGNLLLIQHYKNPGKLGMPTGMLTLESGSGDSSISYTGAFAESANPLWNDSTERLDINQYKLMVGLQATESIDAVSFQLGINDNSLAKDLTTLMGYIDVLYHCFVDDNPNCKFIIGLTTSSGNDVNGSGANYGASYDWIDYLKNVYIIRQFYLGLQKNANYPNMRIAPIHLELDRYYGYNLSSRPVSQTEEKKELYHTNYVHPGISGYKQIADAYFAAYIGALTE